MCNDKLAVQETTIAGFEPQNLNEAYKLFKGLLGTGFLPDHIRTPEQAIMIMLMGRERKIPMITSLTSINVIRGTPSMASSLMVALIRKSGLCKKWKIEENSEDRCTITTQRIEDEDPTTTSFTMADARKMHLDKKDNYIKQPAVMLQHRCESKLARMVYSDVVEGLYDIDEVEQMIEEDKLKGPDNLSTSIDAMLDKKPEVLPAPEVVEPQEYAGYNVIDETADFKKEHIEQLSKEIDKEKPAGVAVIQTNLDPSNIKPLNGAADFDPDEFVANSIKNKPKKEAKEPVTKEEVAEKLEEAFDTVEHMTEAYGDPVESENPAPPEESNSLRDEWKALVNKAIKTNSRKLVDAVHERKGLPIRLDRYTKEQMKKSIDIWQEFSKSYIPDPSDNSSFDAFLDLIEMHLEEIIACKK